MGSDTIAIVFGSIALLFLLANFITSLKITRVLADHGVDINYPLLHVGIYRYVALYKNITQKEEGKTGSLYKQFNLTNWLFMIFLALGILALYLL